MKSSKYALVLLLSASLWAQSAPQKTVKPARKSAKAVAAKKVASPAATASEVKALRDAMEQQQKAIAEQQQQLQQMREELARKDESIRQAAAAASEVQSRVAAVESKTNDAAPASVVESLKSDLADVKLNQANAAASTQDDQSRVASAEGVLNRFRLNGDAHIRYENFFQSYSGCAAPNCNPRNRERLRLRIGFEGQLSEDFFGGVGLATGDLTEPVSTNQTLTGFFNRKAIGWDKGYITYAPRKAKWFQVTGGKFAYTWAKSAMTMDSDINPEGFSQKLSFNVNNSVVKSVSFVGMQMLMSEVSKGADSFAAGGQIASKLQLGSRVTMSPAFTVINWRNTDAIAAAVKSGSITGNAMTNLTNADKTAYLSKFMYLDTILDMNVKTPWARFQWKVMLDYVNNPRAVSNANHGYWIETALGQTKEKGDFQIGYTYARVEQDAIIAAFGESDLRATTNVLQNRIMANYQIARNTTLGYTLWLGRTLNRNLPNAVVPTGLPAGQTDPNLTRMQFDIVYKF
jgi:hypothetical protein